MLETTGLDATLRWLAERHQQRTGVAAEVVGHVSGVSGAVAIACFRVAQEALTNVAQHARAQRVWIELSRTDHLMELVIGDDGVGFDVTRSLMEAPARGHLGLFGMRERAQILGGSLDLDSRPGNGTRIRLSLPLVEAATEANGSAS
jgi:signal transduction histidine kinase